MSAAATFNGNAPATASTRAYLRAGLPAMYREHEFTSKLVGALERVLDPLVGVMDNLHAHIDPALAPAAALDMLGAWLGLERDETFTIAVRRELVANAPRLTRSRGTKEGLELALRLSFPALELTVIDAGTSTWSTDPGALPERSPREFVVVSPVALAPDLRDAVVRVITEVRPVQVAYRLQEPEAVTQDGGAS